MPTIGLNPIPQSRFRNGVRGSILAMRQMGFPMVGRPGNSSNWYAGLDRTGCSMLTELQQDAQKWTGSIANAGAILSLNLDAQNPWPGLAAYDEASRNFFHGRDGEA